MESRLSGLRFWSVSRQSCGYDKQMKIGDPAALKENIQTGIRLTVGAITPNRPGEIVLDDFRQQNKIKLPRQGGLRTPAHKSTSFKFKDYAPKVFRALRNRFGVDAADYMLSICGESSLLGLPSPGKSGSAFFSSHDHTYMIKTMTKSESKFLRSILPEYYAHFVRHPHTLITRYFGLHRVNPRHQSKVHIVVMNNVFDTPLDVDIVYDLKGSTVGRTTRTEATSDRDVGKTLKDLDMIRWKRKVRLDSRKQQLLLRQLELDCQFLAGLGLMDYSLLLGIHIKRTIPKPLTPADPEPSPTATRTPTRLGIDPLSMSGAQQADEGESCETSGPVAPATIRLNHRRRIPVAPNEETAPFRPLSQAGQFQLSDLTVPHPILLQHLTKKLLVSVFQSEDGGLWSEDGSELYFVGVIDLLTKWNVTKVLENRAKGVVHDRHAVSAVNPHNYADRFIEFCERVVGDDVVKEVADGV
ncbi:Phosphatidylinositol-4-phosphate 5-Kinase [Carpediemonas membranifera]|uniref:Phosphatidylinositol-4-phosphate 5-Kinase n=1 Tax=Carpediemonas membranifera TaxID=201153 RepID=A0A8J6AU50_9EUKA|nr:Phosphatidylinositol-4-phosphate 5-Kinase [Carpediemonas membranifera]|eukprot:KAG9394771.1 Phosphatidylinositol-4-phosphate 5-Kinase [Carpediemonas membranifera]